MKNKHIGFLHPGAMGISLAVAAQQSGRQACWVSDGRSPASIERAEQHKLEDAGTLAELCNICPVIVSICPPHAAEDVADEVIDCGFKGIYLDANAISPARAVRIGEALTAAGITFVDGGIIGPPAWQPGTTWLHVSGGAAPEVIECFAASHLSVRVIGTEPGKASALKMCFAARAKGSTALLMAVMAAAESLGVRDELETQWTHYDHAFMTKAEREIGKAAVKAWRFSGEMEEIAATLRSTGMPEDFHQAAKAIYDRLDGFKDAKDSPPLDEVIRFLAGE